MIRYRHDTLAVVFVTSVVTIIATSVAKAANGDHFQLVQQLVPKASDLGPLGIVEGVVSCGSLGQVLQIRVTNCTRVPCDLHMGTTYFVEADFIPAANHPYLTLVISEVLNGGETEIIKQDIGTSVIAGAAYTVVYPLSVTGDLPQGTVYLRLQLYENGIIELCSALTGIVHS